MSESGIVITYSPRRKRVGFRFNDSGVLEVYAPAGMPEALIRKIMAENHAVIERARRDLFRRAAPLRRCYREGETFPFWGKELTLVFSERVLTMTEHSLIVPRGTPDEVRAHLEKLYRKRGAELLREKSLTTGAPLGLVPDSVGITGARTRWGSCSSRKHLSFCWKILLLPPELAEYVVCHELAHLKHMDHSPAFWQLTEKLCPGALAKRKKLQAQPELWPAPADV